MDALRLVVATLALAWSVPAQAQSLAHWQPFVAEAAARFGIPEAWILRVIRAESGGRTMLRGRPIRSPKGAMGLMQLMPGTWAEMRGIHNLGSDPDDPRDNILAGTAYLRAMYDRFGYPGLFAAYNAGPARYARHLATGRALPGETIAYLSAVAGPGRVASPALRGDLFAARSVAAAASDPRPAPPPWRGLFVRLTGQSRSGER